jgi:membrane protease YdiL (CAAX protease family)
MTGALLALVASVLAGLAIDYGRLDQALATALFSLFLLFVPYFSLGIGSKSRAVAVRDHAGRLVLVVGALIGPYLLYAWGTESFDTWALVRLGLFIAAPTILVFIAGLRGDAKPEPGPWDVAAVLAIWLPFDFRLVDDIWTWPEGRGAYGFQAVLAVDLALALFVLVRCIPNIGYRFALSKRDLAVMVGCFVAFSTIAVPLGFFIEFITYQSRAFEVVGFVGSSIAIFLFIGVPEELLFRGLIQNFLETKWGKNAATLLGASIVFGAAHLNNGDAPNWSYMLMATVAGVFYGLAYRKTGKVAAAAVVHALVDAVWRAFFR